MPRAVNATPRRQWSKAKVSETDCDASPSTASVEGEPDITLGT